MPNDRSPLIQHGTGKVTVDRNKPVESITEHETIV